MQVPLFKDHIRVTVNNKAFKFNLQDAVIFLTSSKRTILKYVNNQI